MHTRPYPTCFTQTARPRLVAIQKSR
jgi:hypothetical protein